MVDHDLRYPGYQRFFSRAAGNFGVGRRPTRLRPTAEATSGEAARKTRAFRAGHYKDLTETGNCARKVSGTQGRHGENVSRNQSKNL